MSQRRFFRPLAFLNLTRSLNSQDPAGTRKACRNQAFLNRYPRLTRPPSQLNVDVCHHLAVLGAKLNFTLVYISTGKCFHDGTLGRKLNVPHAKTTCSMELRPLISLPLRRTPLIYTESQSATVRWRCLAFKAQSLSLSEFPFCEFASSTFHSHPLKLTCLTSRVSCHDVLRPSISPLIGFLSPLQVWPGIKEH